MFSSFKLAANVASHVDRSTPQTALPYAEGSAKTSKRPLEPIDRISEVLFGLIMVLTITCSFSIAEADRKQVGAMLIGALGCNLAWGIIDGFMYLMGCLSERGHNIRTLRALRSASNSQDANRILADALPALVASVLSEPEIDSLRGRLTQVSEHMRPPRLVTKDWLGAFGVFLLVSLSTFPIAAPFLFVNNARLALRVSNGIALCMLFLAGYAFGLNAELHPWRMGLWMVLIGSGMVAITMILGG